MYTTHTHTHALTDTQTYTTFNYWSSESSLFLISDMTLNYALLWVEHLENLI